MLRQAQRRRYRSSASSATVLVNRPRTAISTTAATVLTFVNAFACCNAASVHNGYSIIIGQETSPASSSADDEREWEWEWLIEGQPGSESRNFAVLVDVWLADYEDDLAPESEDGIPYASDSESNMQRPRLRFRPPTQTRPSGRLVGKLASGIRTGNPVKITTPLHIVDGDDGVVHLSSSSQKSYHFRITDTENSSRILYESQPIHTIYPTVPNPNPSTTLATRSFPPLIAVEDSELAPLACSDPSIGSPSTDCGSISLRLLDRRQFGGGFGGGGFGGGGFGGTGGTGGFGTGTGTGGFSGGDGGFGGFGGGGTGGGTGSNPVTNSQPSQPQQSSGSNPPQNSQSPAQGTSPSNSSPGGGGGGGGGGGSQPSSSPSFNSALGQAPSTKTDTITTDVFSTIVSGSPTSPSSGPPSSSTSSSSGSTATGASGTKLVRKKPTATISGAILGGAVVFITILIVLIILYRRRRAAQRAAPSAGVLSGSILGHRTGSGRAGWRSGGERRDRDRGRVESFREDKRAWDAEWNGANGGGGGKHGNAQLFAPSPTSDRSSSLQHGSSEAIAGTTIATGPESLRRSHSADRDEDLKSSNRRKGSRSQRRSSGRTSSGRRVSSSTTAHLRSLSESMSISGSTSIGSTLREHHASLTSTLYGPEPSPGLGSDSGLKLATASSTPGGGGPGLAPPNTPATPPHLPIPSSPPPPLPILVPSINASTYPHSLQAPPQRRHSETNSLSGSLTSDIGLLPIAPSKKRTSRRGTDASSSNGHQDVMADKEKEKGKDSKMDTVQPTSAPATIPAPALIPAPAPVVVRYSTPASSHIGSPPTTTTATRGLRRGHNSYSHPLPHPPSHPHSLTSAGVLAPISSSFTSTTTGATTTTSRAPPFLSLSIAEDRFSDEFGDLDSVDIDALSLGYTSAPTTARPISSRPPLPALPLSATTTTSTTTAHHTSMNAHLSSSPTIPTPMTSAALRIPPRPPTPPPTPPVPSQQYGHNRQTIEADGMSVFTIPDDPPPQYRRTLIQPVDIPLPDSAHHHPQPSRFTAPP